MQVTIRPNKGKARMELADKPNPRAALGAALYSSGLNAKGVGYSYDPIEVSPDATFFELVDAKRRVWGVAEVSA